ncbi:anaerobic dehydrogenase-like protein [Natrialba chahannaoensis JCM 10990]|uniref:Anaerobic dehydrogenase-like protein n=1 Tax=Natrialba chahannaoensis JCM 10990 TaxID=1227492 RepID=M0B2L5_9EURY|nr:molecular chaperone TorD family protein [Natrialba chahannaoensis]ELZ04807.1 anaerobic dehydrogenase-like protein [Natrialba chahannaoensis JCM 10990]
MTTPPTRDPTEMPNAADSNSKTARESVHRARLYKLLSLAFDRPGETLESALVSGTFDEQLLESAAVLDGDVTDESEENDPTTDAHGDLHDAATTVVDASPATQEAVDEHYSTWTSLFGFETGGDIPQYEIEFSPGTLVTSTDTLSDIAGFYDAFGLSLAEDRRERVDHLCIELEFVSQLALQTAALAKKGDETGIEIVTDAQGSFIEDHLGRWLPRYREAIEDADVGDDGSSRDEQEGRNKPDETAFYDALAVLACQLVERDADRFAVEPDVFAETPAEPSPLEGLTNSEGEVDFRCGTCGSGAGPSSAPATEPGPEPQLPMGNREGPY